MASREYGVDVAIYQSANMAKYHNASAKYAIVKLTEGTGYFNPLAEQQTTNARNAHMYVHAYHFANFGNSTAKAKAEAAYFLKHAKECNMAKSRYLWLDWEGNTYNYTGGSKSANTAAILAFMRAIRKAGYKTGLYSGAALLKSSVDTRVVVKEFGSCLWVASYPVSGAVSSPDFNYFPSMDGVAVWQFTDNWKGLGVDGNVSVIDLHPDAGKTAQATKKEAKPTAKKTKTWKDSAGHTWEAKSGTFTTSTVINLRNGASTSSALIAGLPAGSKVKFDAMSTHGGYTWLRQPRLHGYGYRVCQSSSGEKYGKIK